MENIYVQFEGMVSQKTVGIPVGRNCAPLIADLFLIRYDRDFMSNTYKSKQFDLVDMFKANLSSYKPPYLFNIVVYRDPGHYAFIFSMCIDPRVHS